MSDHEFAYLAGFFDADGCVSISKRTDVGCKRGVSFRLALDVAQKTPQILQTFKALWGGTVCKGRRCERWFAYSNNAAGCLSDLLPYLRLKKAEARVAVGFQHRKATRGNRGIRGLTEDEFNQERADYQLLRCLKQRRQ